MTSRASTSRRRRRVAIGWPSVLVVSRLIVEQALEVSVAVRDFPHPCDNGILLRNLAKFAGFEPKARTNSTGEGHGVHFSKSRAAVVEFSV